MPYLFVLLCLIFLFFELVALWAELSEAFLGLLSFGSLLSFLFIPWEWSGRRAVPAAGSALICFEGFVGGSAALFCFLFWSLASRGCDSTG